MTRDEIIRMAREAECEETWGADAFRFAEEELERFAALVAAAEREACAKVCDAEFWNATKRDGDAAGVAAGNCAAAIRARSNVQQEPQN